MMAIRSSPTLGASRRDARATAWSDSLFRIVALLLLVVQLGVIAHRVEHYFVPEQMECGEDSCTAFAPATGAAAPLVYLPTLLLVFYVLKFWTVREAAVTRFGDRLGFTAHAPPV